MRVVPAARRQALGKPWEEFMRTFFGAVSIALGLMLLPFAAQAQGVGGNLAAFANIQELYLNITETADGRTVIDTDEFRLITGAYYRLNITSTGETDWRVEMPDLLSNSHLRILTVDRGVEIHLQGMVFRAIEFDEPGHLVQLSFVPIRTGTFGFAIGPNPIAVGLAAGTAGVCPDERCVRGVFIVE
jgi:hypothetical protein